MIAALLASCATFHPLTPSLARQAAREGVALASSAGGYKVAPWVIYQSKDPLSAVHGKAGIDAIILETPYERVRYYAYLHRLQGDTVTGALVKRLYLRARNRLGFVVYAHSRSDTDRTFLNGFGDPLLDESGTVERPLARSIFGPSSDFYDVGSFREQRWVGSLTVRFGLPHCAGNERFTISGPYGLRYAVPFDLLRYR